MGGICEQKNYLSGYVTGKGLNLKTRFYSSYCKVTQSSHKCTIVHMNGFCYNIKNNKYKLYYGGRYEAN